MNKKKIAIISDIHANLEALTTVLADIENEGIEYIISLGDNLGYGPNPKEVLDLLMKKVAFSMLGNHDYHILTDKNIIVNLSRVRLPVLHTCELLFPSNYSVSHEKNLAQIQL